MATTSKSRPRSKSPTVQISFAKFDTRSPTCRVVREAVPIAEFQDITREDFRPQGGTPLIDATADFIAHLDSLRSPEFVTIGVLIDESGSQGDSYRGAGYEAAIIDSVNKFVAGMRDVPRVDPKAGGTVLAVVVTDGEENSSRRHTYADLSKLIAAREAEGFTFIFLGADIDAWAQGTSLGFSGTASGQSVNFVATPKGVANAMNSVTTDSSSYLTNNAMYASYRSRSSLRSIAEDGTESTVNSGTTMPSVVVPQVYQSALNANVDDAIRRAKDVTS